MNEHESYVLNDDFNQWYRHRIEEYARLYDLKKHPEEWKHFKFDIEQAKRDAVLITDDVVVKQNSPKHLKTTADILCIGRTTVHDLSKKDY